ncbi:MAG: hypothetical protein Q8N23_12040 [Archangium sp.]|nr:hypothetical protein [Archangium sp.]MDP3153398.1 hypothetical protein [Archangium sp.]MDP3573444.1 hypothetical protein [Archangium sp.]
MKTSKPKKWTAVSLVVTAVASTIALAVNAWNRARRRALASVNPRLSIEDKSDIKRMENEGGPPLAPVPVAK